MPSAPSQVQQLQYPTVAQSRRATPPAAVVRVYCTLADGQKGIGSGSLILISNGKGVIITNEHVVRGSQSIEVAFPRSGRFGGTLLGTDSTSDLAAIAIRAPNVKPLPIRKSDPKIGERIHVGGYGGNGVYHLSGGIYRGDSATGKSMFIGAPVVGGDSGAPALDANGHLAGVVWGCGGYETVCVRLPRLRKFMTRIRARNAWMGNAAQEGLAQNWGIDGIRSTIPEAPSIGGDGADQSAGGYPCPPSGNLVPLPAPGYTNPVPQPPQAEPPVAANDPPEALLAIQEQLSAITDRLGPLTEELASVKAGLQQLKDVGTEAPEAGPAGEQGLQGQPGVAGQDGERGQPGAPADMALLTAIAARFEQLELAIAESRQLSDADLDRIANVVKAKISGSIRVQVTPETR